MNIKTNALFIVKIPVEVNSELMNTEIMVEDFIKLNIKALSKKKGLKIAGKATINKVDY